MLSLDVSSALAKAITPSKGIPEQELTGLNTGMKRYIAAFLIERERGQHAWSMSPYDKHVIQKIKEVAIKAKSERIRPVVWIGIGGSGLGPRVIQEVFERPGGREFLVLDTLDPSVLSMILGS